MCNIICPLPPLQGVRSVSSGRRRLVFVGSTSGLSVYTAVDGGGPQLVAQSEEMRVRTMAVGHSREGEQEMHVVAVRLETGASPCISVS